MNGDDGCLNYVLGAAETWREPSTAKIQSWFQGDLCFYDF